MDHSHTLDQNEVDRFNSIAQDWWNPSGPFAPLHKLGPTRLKYIRDQVCTHYKRDPDAPTPLNNLSILDIGCGGGLVCEPLSRMGANVTGIDPGSENIAAATAHAQTEGLTIGYKSTTAEELAETGAVYDCVLCLEVVEHVPDVPAFLQNITPLVKPDGLLILSTINRTIKSYALAIIAAEYILRWLEPGTHQWDRFVKPEELSSAVRISGCRPLDETGLMFNPISDTWTLTKDTDVNYFLSAKKGP